MDKSISKSKNPGLAKMAKTEKGKKAVAKMGFNPNRMTAKKGGRAQMMDGGVANHQQISGFGAVRPDVKSFGKGKK